LGVENDGTRALYEALKKEKLTILALGPMTNIATLIQNHPILFRKSRKFLFVRPELRLSTQNGKLNVLITTMSLIINLWM
jgi:pyrimidine-specific ribonucleoside hydrolase